MSSLLGGPGARYPLDRAVDELAAAGRWAGPPGLVWLAGLFFPSLLINLGVVQGLVHLFGRAIGRDLSLSLLTGGSTLAVPLLPALDADSPGEMLVLTIVLVPPALLLYRLHVGLAAIAAPTDPTPPRTLRSAWAAGRGQARAALGMWLVLLALFVVVLAFLFGPALVLVQVFAIDRSPALLTLVVAPTALLGLGYGVVLLVLHMLALQSLAHNRRGVASALTHAWRLVRADPWGAVRACLVDLSLQALLVGASIAASLVLKLTLVGVPLVGLAHLLLRGVAGVTRASFWARSYRALGGPLPSDRLPGL